MLSMIRTRLSRCDSNVDANHGPDQQREGEIIAAIKSLDANYRMLWKASGNSPPSLLWARHSGPAPVFVKLAFANLLAERS